MYAHFCEKYPVISIEDPFEQDDWTPCGELTSKNICQVGASLVQHIQTAVCGLN